MVQKIGRTVIVSAKVVEYDTSTGRALIVPTDADSPEKESMTIPFKDILKWEERNKPSPQKEGDAA
ncbi:hypothetical protein [Methylosinus sp. PW1]|uniref:hypothetical protein n=1 Tax=Methylosinus sp. PW1 TaxID=107636 RepID=UPI0012EB1D43|nr:hypothetical protein [Methylosinus sp. PW1]